MSKPKPTLETTFCGIKCLNPFWLASGPPTNSEYQVRRAFDAGWGGAVWKTLGHEPIVNVTSPDDHDVTLGNLCIKGRFGYRFVETG